MLKTFLFMTVVAFATTVSAQVQVDHISTGVPASVDVPYLISQDHFLSKNVLPITGFHSDGTNLQFSLIYNTCGGLIKNTAFSSDYLLVAPSIVLVKLKLNPEYASSLIEQSNCHKDRPRVKTISRQVQFFFVREIAKKYPDISKKDLQVIVINEYQNVGPTLDLTSEASINETLRP